MKHISQIVPNDKVVCYMRPGLALRIAVNQRTKEAYRYVPSKPEAVRNDSLEAFYGLVISNDVTRRIIRLQTSRMTIRTFPTGSSTEVAEIPWNAIQRMRLYSKIVSPGHPPVNPARPTSMDPLGYWDAQPYHILEEINLYGDS